MDEAIKTEFERLKAGVGMTPADLAACPVLLGLLGTTDIHEAEQRLRDVIAKMGDNRYAEALTTALGVDYFGDKKSLVGRREWLMEYKKVKTTDTIKSWELKGQEQFVTMAKATVWPYAEQPHNIGPVYRLDDPFTAPHDCEFVESWFNCSIFDQRLNRIESYHGYRHTPTGRRWSIREDEDEFDLAALLSRPIIHEVLLFNNAPAVQQRVVVSGHFWTLDRSQPSGSMQMMESIQTIKAERFVGLGQLSSGRGEELSSTEQQSSLHKGSARNYWIFRDDNPVANCYYRLSWEYTRPPSWPPGEYSGPL